VTWAFTNDLPVPVASTVAEKEREPSPPALKSTAVTVKVPSAAAVTALLESMAPTWALPQGDPYRSQSNSVIGSMF
jgi:hypothetical protein